MYFVRAFACFIARLGTAQLVTAETIFLARAELLLLRWIGRINEIETRANFVAFFARDFTFWTSQTASRLTWPQVSRQGEGKLGDETMDWGRLVLEARP